jgi:hypothetical protein
MSKTLLIASMVMIIIWALGFWVFHISSIIHITLVFAGLFLVMSYSIKKHFSKFPFKSSKD